jgi:beta-lactamase superfamily II metal-dependent hydrolase
MQQPAMLQSQIDLKMRMLRFFTAIAVVFLATSVQGAQSVGDQVGQRISPWVYGTLDIHQVSTGRGNAALVVMPDGTTLLIDAGDASAPFAEPRPNGSRSPAGWIWHYIDSVLPSSSQRRLDYALITHFHADHMGGIAELAGLVPIRKIVDRGWPDYSYPAPLTDTLVQNYRRFLEQRVSGRSLNVERIRVGRADQFVPVLENSSRYPSFEIRNVAGNGEVWTGKGTSTVKRFPEFKSLNAEIPWENICSIGVRIRYGLFDFFTGGDAYGIADPGMSEWVDLETPIAKAIGQTDVHVVNMHGSISVENPFFVTALRSRVTILPSWSATHPSADVLKRLLAPLAYPGPRDIFATVLREPTRISLGPRADQIKGLGHIVIRVSDAGATYRIVVVDDTTDTLIVKSIHGPYESH